MYVLPSQKRIKELIITKDMVDRKAAIFDTLLEIVDDAAA